MTFAKLEGKSGVGVNRRGEVESIIGEHIVKWTRSMGFVGEFSFSEDNGIWWCGLGECWKLINESSETPDIPSEDLQVEGAGDRGGWDGVVDW